MKFSMSGKRLSKFLIVGSFLVSSFPTYGQTAPAAPAGTRIALISIQDAITRTQEGQKRTQELRQRFSPTEAEVKQKQDEIATLREQLNRGTNTMSDDAKRKVLRQIQTKERQLQRFTEDAEREFQREFQQFQQEVFAKVRTIIRKYMNDKGYSLVLDISNPQTPVVDASNELLITNDIIQLYDQENPVTAASAAPAPAAPAAASSAPAAAPAPTNP
jgi:outer membrane protein